jgi:hypothetical protein
MLQQLMQRGGGGGGPKPLVEFKAGRMNYDGRMVTPDRRRGLIRVIQDSTGMKIFQFCDAETKNPIDSETVYVFPGEAKFEKVKQTQDRVYLLEISGGVQRKFFWMQVSSEVVDFDRRKTRKRMRNEQSRCTTQSTTSRKRRPRRLSQWRMFHNQHLCSSQCNRRRNSPDHKRQLLTTTLHSSNNNLCK